MNWIGLYSITAREIHRFMRTMIQSLVSPWISAALYIFVFGFVVGARIDTIAGVRYIEFVIPGVLMLNLISSSFSQANFSIYFGKFTRYIEEMLVAPLSNFEMVLGFVLGAVVRGTIVAAGVYGVAIVFGVAAIAHPFLFLAYSIAVALIFAFLGIIMGLWAKTFEQLTMLNTFVITPLTFLGGVFNSIEMLPPALQTATRFNPFFYFVDGLRYSMTGIQEADPVIGWAVILGLVLALGAVSWKLFSSGWRIRD